MFKKNTIGYLIFILLIFEVLAFYFDFFWVNLALKFLLVGGIFLYYCLEIKPSFINYDRIFLVSLIFSFLGEICFVIPKNDLITSILLFSYLIEHQIYIVLMRRPSMGSQSFSFKAILLAGWPYLLAAFLFFGFFLMEIVPDSVFLLMVLYVFQFAMLGAHSLMLNEKFTGKPFLISGVIFMVLSDILSSWYIFLGKFPADYLLIRVSYVSAKILLTYGFLKNRKMFIR